MKKRNFYLSEKQVNSLSKYSKAMDLTISELIRRSIDKFIEEKESKNESREKR